MKSTAEILEVLKDRGYKKTQVREHIVSRLLSVKKPLDALALGEFLAKKGTAVNKTTIYREIQFLLEQGIIIEINFGDNKKRYEIAGLPHHHHLVCLRCRRVEDVFADSELASLEKRIEKETAFAIESHSLEFFGLCRNCR